MIPMKNTGFPFNERQSRQKVPDETHSMSASPIRMIPMKNTGFPFNERQSRQNDPDEEHWLPIQ
jgi:hypothetical protein